MIGTIVGATALAALGLYLKQKVFTKQTATSVIDKAKAEMEEIIVKNSQKIEDAIVTELSVMKTSAGVVLHRIETLGNTDALHDDVTKALAEASTSIKAAVAKVETALNVDKVHNV